MSQFKYYSCTPGPGWQSLSCFVMLRLFLKCKVHTYLEASFHFTPVTPKVLPQLKPNQPHQSMNVPRRTFVGEAIALGGIFISNLPIRGFSIMVATRPLTPPTKCTGPQPAMSTTPILRSQPFSAQIQCAGNVYVRVLTNE